MNRVAYLCMSVLAFLLSCVFGDEVRADGGRRIGVGLNRDGPHLSHTQEFASLSDFAPGSCPYDVRASVREEWKKRTSKRSSGKVPLLWISSREGLLSHFFQTEKLWRIVVLQHRRPLVIAPFTSWKHYGYSTVRLCDYFEFPRDIMCVKAPAFSREDVPVHPPKCRCPIVANLTTVKLPQFSVFGNPEYFNLSTLMNLPPADGGQFLLKPRFAEEQCIAGFVDQINNFPEPPPFKIVKFPFYQHSTVNGVPVSSVLFNLTDGYQITKNITVPLFPQTSMSRRFVGLVPVLRAALGVEGVGLHAQKNWPLPFISSHTDHSSNALVVVHWRRGDYLAGSNNRCSRKLDISVNCNSTKDFINEVKLKMEQHRYARRYSKITVYVATNEDDPKSLNELRSAGFKVKQDIIEGLGAIVEAERQNHNKIQLSDIFPLYLPLSPADDFAIDMVLVCSAEEHIHFGYSNYNKFIIRCRPKRRRKVTRKTKGG